MDWYVRAFIRSSVTWLVTGVTVGLVMVLWPRATVYRTAHLHLLLLGFISMMIFGFAYHVVPRLAGNRLYRVSWAAVHVWLANLGVALLALGFALRVHGVGAATPALIIGGTSATVGAYLFALNILLSTRERKRMPAPPTPGRAPLPTVATGD